MFLLEKAFLKLGKRLGSGLYLRSKTIIAKILSF